jgi:hypothetical protein
MSTTTVDDSYAPLTIITDILQKYNIMEKGEIHGDRAARGIKWQVNIRGGVFLSSRERTYLMEA